MEDKKCCICFKPAVIKAFGTKDTYICEKCLKDLVGEFRRLEEG